MNNNKLKNAQRGIIYNIISAQIASDAGKGIYDIHFNKIAAERGYNAKEHYIVDAVKGIDSIPYCGINYYLVKKDDQHNNPSIISYFTIKAGGNTYQVSFHTPLGEDEGRALLALAKRHAGVRQHWRYNKNLDSRGSCKALKAIYSL